MPRVTVAILAYNRPDYLAEAIESVLAQTYNDYKLIVYDNCSEKDLKSVVDRYDDSRIIYHRNEKNLGQFGNAAQAVDLCDTELLDILHDDDRLFPWALERLVEAMDKYPNCGMASAGRWHVMGSGSFAKYKNITTGTYYKKMELAVAASKRHTYLVFSGIMLRVAKLREYSFNYVNNGPVTDYFFSLKGNILGIESFRYDAPMIEYRVHSGSDSAASKYEVWRDSWQHVVDEADLLEDKNVALGIKNDALSDLMIGCYIHSQCKDDKSDMDAILNEIARLEKKWNCIYDFKQENFSIGYLYNTIVAVGRGEVPISRYRERMKYFEKSGFKVPFTRKLKWFLKYVVWQRWLGRH